MGEGYAIVDYEAAEPTTSAKSDRRRVELADALGCTEMGLRVWHLDPGDSIVYHTHRTQEEVYLPLGGSGRIRIDGALYTVDAGEAVRVSPETPRQLTNDTDEPTVWLAIGAPPVENDGVYLDDPE